MARPSKYPRELRETVVRAVVESVAEGRYPGEFEAIRTISSKLGIGSPETLRKWVRQAEVDGGARPGKTTAETQEVKREVAELPRANEILKAASAFFAAELGRPSRF